MTVILVVSDRDRFICVFRFKVPGAPLHLCTAVPGDYHIQKMDWRSLKDAPRQPTYIGVCVYGESGKKERERCGGAEGSRRCWIM